MMGNARRFARFAIGRAARDETATSAGRSALVLAPHPDDETLGCGATILRKIAAGTAVTVAILTDGRHSHDSSHLGPDSLAALRRTEMAEAARRLGLSPGAVRWAGFVDGSLTENEDAAVEFVGELLTELRPEEIYSTCVEEPHPDHAALGRAARRAVVNPVNATRLLEYPVWLWGSWPVRRGDRLGSAIDALAMVLSQRATRIRAEGYLSGKLHALEAHASQLRRPDVVPPDEEWPVLPPWLLEVAGDYAELFLPWRPPIRRAAVAAQ